MDRLAQANYRLKADKSRCSIEQRGDRLLLRATLPPKPTATRQDWHRQRIFLGVNSTHAGVSFAESEARKISALLDQGLFVWQPYLKQDEANLDFKQWIEKFKAHKISQGISQTTWQKDYFDLLKILENLNSDDAIASVRQIAPNTRKRSRTCIAITAFFKFTGIEIDLKPYKGSYSPTTVQPRDIPTDATIQDCFFKLKDSLWGWAFGAMAVYGIRPEELMVLEFDEMPVLIVRGDKSATSDRKTYPIYPEWVELFDLVNVHLPRSKDTGKQACKQFKRYEIPFTPYDLRHAWAIRSMEFGLPLELAAQQMGHSMTVHSQTYHKWISDRHHKQAFDRIMAKPDRITPPIVTNRLLLINGGK